ncbi:MAG: phospho-N-acetylmuramoyl-pentapeptide-transferase [Opitutales bacterium]
MLHRLSELENLWGPFRLFDYLSVRMILAFVSAMLIGLILSGSILRRLARLRQPERDARLMGDLAKQGGKVPTMGGLLIAAAMLPSVLLWARCNLLVAAALVALVGMGAIGWYDDWLKVRHGNADGVSARAKLAGQFLVAALAFGVLLADPEMRRLMSEVWVPVLKQPIWGPGVLGLPFPVVLAAAGTFFCLVAVGSSNAVNLTDGLDGLAIGCVLVTTLVLGVVAYLVGDVRHAEYLQIRHVTGAGELGVLCCALAGGSLVFLWHNAAPADVYMGDVGALGIGGFLGAVACLIHQPFLLAIAGGVFVIEAASVILQVAYFKRTGGRRLFLMTPIHHHFQKLGWPATKVVVRFWILSLLCGLLGLLSLKLR